MTDNPQPGSLLQARNLSMAFGGLVVFKDISLDIFKNQIVALIGPNGAGKTTLFNVIAGRLPPTSGRVFMDGEDITGLPPERFRVIVNPVYRPEITELSAEVPEHPWLAEGEVPVIVAAGILLFIQGIAQVMRCILAIRTNQWLEADEDVLETEDLLMREADKAEGDAHP